MSLLCSHLSSLLEGVVNQADINQFVTLMEQKIPSGTYGRACKQLGTGLKKWYAGYPDPFRSCDEFFHMVEIDHEKYGKGQLSLCVPNSPFLLHILEKCKEPNSLTDNIIAGLMKLHTTVMAPKRPSQSAIEKARSTIISPGPAISKDLHDRFTDVADRLVKSFYGFKPRIETYLPLSMVPANSLKNSYSLVRHKSVPRVDLDLYNIEALISHAQVKEILKLFPEELGHCLKTAGQGKIIWTDKALNLEQWDGPLGSISMIPELGEKYRVVASPNVGLLCMNNPLREVLSHMTQTLKTQGVSSHENTTKELQAMVDGRRTFHSFDMTAFTDRFPYLLQRNLLTVLRDNHVITDYDIKVQDLICHAQFDFRKEPVQYAVGTPMGTFASFPLASLSNGIVAHLCYETAIGHKVNPSKDCPYRIIGDDTVIYHDKAAAIYRNVMTELGVEIDDNKSLSSNQAVQMCSKWITSTGVYLQKKVKPVTTDESFIEAYRYYNGRIQVSPERELLLSLPYPYGVMEEDQQFILNRLARIKAEFNSFDSLSPTKGDLEILFGRDQHRDLFNIEPIARVTPMLLTEDLILIKSLHRDGSNTIQSLKREDDINMFYEHVDELERVANLISILSKVSRHKPASSQETGPFIGTVARDEHKDVQLEKGSLSLLRWVSPSVVQQISETRKGGRT